MATPASASAATGTLIKNNGDEVITRYMEDPEIKELLARAHKLRHLPGTNDPLLISDYFSEGKDSMMLQWVDLVMEGGGMLGIAHVGAVAAFEEAGIRFLGIAGTSAGAINAALIATLRTTPDKQSWRKTLQILATTNFNEFEDGNCLFVKLRKCASRQLSGRADPAPGSCGSFLRRVFSPLLIWVSGLVLMCLPGIKNAIMKDMGLHPGDKFFEWMKRHMKDNGVNDLADLHRKLELREDLEVTDQSDERRNVTEMLNNERKSKFPLKLITAEVTEHQKVELPQEMNDYWDNNVHPAQFVRCSMSIPIFFQPVRVKRVREKPLLPKEAVFVDGGILSNFCIDVFHDKGAVPRRPTLGVRLSAQRQKTAVDGPLKFLNAMIDTSTHLHDDEFLNKHRDYKNLITAVDTNGFDFLDFKMKEEDQRKLFKKGMAAAVRFLEKWKTSDKKWMAYKDVRKKLAQIPAGSASEDED